MKVGGTVHGGSGSNTIHGGLGNDNVHMDLGSDTFIYSALGGRDTILGAGSDDRIVLDGVAGFGSIADVQAGLQAVGSSTELSFSDNTHKLVFSGMSISQVLGLDWSFV